MATNEIFESDESVLQKAATIADWIRKSKHFIAFTGAGVSTATGIPDFRGPQGVWTMKAQGVVVPRGNTLNKIPTPSHMALLQLTRSGTLKYLVSQNTDGLHRRSGFPPNLISELHGNSTRESCSKCGREYIRDFSTRGPTASDHRSGRTCSTCGGVLHDTIINFGESLPKAALNLAFQHAEMADLCLVLGSSLRVTPAADIPEAVGAKKGAKLVICNLQPTPLDAKADLVVHAKCDDLMQAICAELGVEIPEFILERRLQISTSVQNTNLEVSIKGEDVDGTPATFLRIVEMQFPDTCQTNELSFSDEPYFASTKVENPQELVGESVHVTLQFMGWYNEPNLEFSFPIQIGKESTEKESKNKGKGNKAEEKVLKLLLLYQPSNGSWKILGL